MSEGLKSCPFCGGDDLEIPEPYCPYIRCLGCSAEGPFKRTEDEANKAWNTRAGEMA